jgi:ADP-ribose pyrophosphatase YjhB (NUDIX family)
MMNFHIRVRACALIIENDSVLLVEFTDENGVHFNLPAGGAEPGETLIEAVRREAKEEAGVDVEVGSLVFVSEDAPHQSKSGISYHSLSLMFNCKIKNGSIPHFPSNPDVNQTGVKWIPLIQLDNIILYPNIKEQIIQYVNGELKEGHFINEFDLEEQKILK